MEFQNDFSQEINESEINTKEKGKNKRKYTKSASINSFINS